MVANKNTIVSLIRALTNKYRYELKSINKHIANQFYQHYKSSVCDNADDTYCIDNIECSTSPVIQLCNLNTVLLIEEITNGVRLTAHVEGANYPNNLQYYWFIPSVDLVFEPYDNSLQVIDLIWKHSAPETYSLNVRCTVIDVTDEGLMMCVKHQDCQLSKSGGNVYFDCTNSTVCTPTGDPQAISQTVNSITVDWTTNILIHDIEVYDTYGALVKKVYNVSNPYTITGLQVATTYTIVIIQTCPDGTQITAQDDLDTNSYSCSSPIISVVGTTPDSISILITNFSNTSTYDISIDNGATWILLAQTVNAYTLTGLTSSTTYPIKVRQHCSNTGIGDGTQSATTSAAITCGVPTISISGMTSNTSTASFILHITNFNFGGPTDDYYYSIDGGITWSSLFITAATTVLGLSCSTVYQVKVKKLCAAGGTSYSTIIAATTPAPVYAAPIAPDFSDPQDYLSNSAAGPNRWPHLSFVVEPTVVTVLIEEGQIGSSYVASSGSLIPNSQHRIYYNSGNAPYGHTSNSIGIYLKVKITLTNVSGVSSSFEYFERAGGLAYPYQPVYQLDGQAGIPIITASAISTGQCTINMNVNSNPSNIMTCDYWNLYFDAGQSVQLINGTTSTVVTGLSSGLHIFHAVLSTNCATGYVNTSVITVTIP